MTARRPPALATWLLDRLGYTAANPALAGDLQEEFQRGRSAAWYWRQTFHVATAFPRRMGVLPALFGAATLTGFALEFPAAYYVWRLQSHVSGAGWIALGWALLLGFPLVAGLLQAYLVPSNRKRAIARGTGALRDAVILFAAQTIKHFGVLVFCDCLALRMETLSFSELTICHFFWLPALVLAVFLQELTPAGSRLVRQPESDSLPSHELALPVTLAGGHTITLRPENLVSTLFQSDDYRLCRSLRWAPSLALVRRAIWLGCARNYQADLMGDSPILTLSGLMSLLQEVARTERLDEIAAIPLPGEAVEIVHEMVYVKV